MTVTNHMMTGALVALAVHRPIAAIPLAFLSHFLIDGLPHYGYGNIPFEQRDVQKHFVLKQAIDAYFALALLWFIPFLLRAKLTPLVTTWAMLAGFMPDAIWPYQYVMARRRNGGTYPEHNWYAKFHKRIQWCEKPWGIYIEMVWFILMCGGLKLLAS